MISVNIITFVTTRFTLLKKIILLKFYVNYLLSLNYKIHLHHLI